MSGDYPCRPSFRQPYVQPHCQHQPSVISSDCNAKEEMTARLLMMVKATRRRKRGFWIVLGLIVVGILCAFCLSLQVFPLASVWEQGAIVFLWLSFVLPLGALLVRTEVATSYALAYTEDIRAIAPIVEALECGYAMPQAIAKVTLMGLLPQLTTQEAWRLDEMQRACLRRALTPKNARYSDFQIVTMEALTRIGDTSSLPYIEKLAQSGVVTESQRQVREVAQDCLPFLLALSAQEEAQRTLLRPVVFPCLSSEQLLHSVAVSSDETQQLLRPELGEETTHGYFSSDEMRSIGECRC